MRAPFSGIVGQRFVSVGDYVTSASRLLTLQTFDPQRLLLNRELGTRLDEALRELPEKLRTVVLLFDLEGLPYDEIAEVVGCPLGTVKPRLFNARSALRQKLAPYLGV